MSVSAKTIVQATGFLFGIFTKTFHEAELLPPRSTAFYKTYGFNDPIQTIPPRHHPYPEPAESNSQSLNLLRFF